MPSGAPTAGGHLVLSPDETPARDFWVYGLRVRSAIDLVGWPVVSDAEPDVIIRREPLAEVPLGGDSYSARAVVEDGELRLGVRGVGRYAAFGGSLIRVDADRGAKPEDVRLYLTGALMGVILHQRGTLPLHASCVALPLDGGCVAFAGPSGAGKSTLVAELIRQGCGFVSDDLCVMAPAARGELRVWPGAARLKLDETSLGRTSSRGSDLEPAGGGRGKFHLPMDASLHHTSPAPLSRVCILTDGDGPPRVEPLVGLEAIAALVDQTYLLSTARAMGLTSQVFRLAAGVARGLTVCRLIRPRGLGFLPAVAELVTSAAGRPAAILHPA